MAGDKKGKGKAVVEVKKKKRTREERDRALAAAAAADQPQRSVRIRGRGREAEGATRDTTVTPLRAYSFLRDSSAHTASSHWSTDPRGCSSEVRHSHTATAVARAAVRG